MTTSFELPTNILRDIVKIQGEELLRVRLRIEEVTAAKERLSQDLEDAREEIRQLRAAAISDLRSEASAERTTISAHLPHLRSGTPDSSESEDDGSPPIDGAVEPGHAIGLFRPDGFTPLRPFRTGERLNKKAVKRAKPFLAPNTVLLPVKNEFVLGPHTQDGSLILPCQSFRSHQGQFDPVPKSKSWSKFSNRNNEIFASVQNKCYYLGTYGMSSSEVMESDEFYCLPSRTKETVYRASASKSARKLREGSSDNLAALYATGRLHAVKITLRRVAFNSTIEEVLFQTSGSAVNA